MELLAAITLLATLGALAFAMARSAAQKTRRAESIQVMRQIGASLATYTVDHGRLPGPLNSAHSPFFSTSNKNLISYLWPYFNLPARPQTQELLPQFVPRHWRAWFEKQDPAASRLYRTTMTVTEDGREVSPWGNSNQGIPVPRWLEVNATIRIADTVALRDLYLELAPSYALPKAGELQNYSARLFFDWHVDTIGLPR